MCVWSLVCAQQLGPGTGSQVLLLRLCYCIFSSPSPLKASVVSSLEMRAGAAWLGAVVVQLGIEVSALTYSRLEGAFAGDVAVGGSALQQHCLMIMHHKGPSSGRGCLDTSGRCLCSVSANCSLLRTLLHEQGLATGTDNMNCETSMHRAIFIRGFHTFLSSLFFLISPRFERHGNGSPEL